ANSSDWDAPLFRTRLDAITHRLETGRAKGLYEIVDSNMPVQILVPGFGIRGLLMNRQLLPEHQAPLLLALEMNAIDIGLIELLYEANPYRCPLALAATCDGRTDACADGIADLTMLPQTRVCWVRRELQNLGYAI